ncbi:MAG: VOC family protein [Pseudomonadota bacterium]
MPLQAFDHVNVRTARLDETVAFYGEVLGLVPGERPDFGFPGAWLYLGDRALVHLIGVEGSPVAGQDLSLEHFAFSATGVSEFVAKLDSLDVDYTVNTFPGIPVVQVNFFDPNGIHIHVDFPKSEWDG